MCDKTYNASNFKVRDHCHLRNKYRGPLCYYCNLSINYKPNYRIPVYAHN